MSSQSKQRKNLYQLVLCAVLIALATVLGMIKFLNLPYGGSITLMSMLAASLCLKRRRDRASPDRLPRKFLETA